MAFLRRWQQSYWVQLVVAPALIAGGIAAGLSLLASSGGDLSQLGVASLKKALGLGGAGALAYVIGIMQHGPGSASYKSDGTRNVTVDNVVMVQKAAEAAPVGSPTAYAAQKVDVVAHIEAAAVKEKS